MKIKAILISILLIAMTVSLVANEPYRVGTTAANFLEMGVGSAANGMGDAYVAATRDLSSVYWNAAGLASGTYFVILNADNTTMTRSAVLIK